MYDSLNFTGTKNGSTKDEWVEVGGIRTQTGDWCSKGC